MFLFNTSSLNTFESHHKKVQILILGYFLQIKDFGFSV